MRQFIARRLLAMIPTLIFITVAVAGLIRLAPGDVILAQIGEAGFANPELLETFRKEMGLDKPFHIQYLSWVGGIFQGDLGVSMSTFQKARSHIFSTLPVTIQLAFMAMILGLTVAVPVGLFSALRQDTVGDYVARVIAILGVAVPHFWIGILFLVFMALWFNFAPPLQYKALVNDPLSNLRQMIFPAMILGSGLSASAMRMIRSTTLEVIRQDYIRTAYAKGLSERLVVVRHVMKNAFIPVITIVGGQMAFLMGGSVIMETLFNLPGIGRLTYHSVNTRDYVQLQANILIFASWVLFVNFVVDVSYAWFDPRIRFN